MTDRDDEIDETARLRSDAEAIARKVGAPPPEDLEALSFEEAQQMIQELRVHQIELKMQNEELRRARQDLETARAHYFELYDLAPVGYCTINDKGLILEANLTAATLLGVARSALVKQPISRFIHREDQDIYYLQRKQLFETGKAEAQELRFVKQDGAQLWVQLTTTTANDASNAPLCYAVLLDLTKRKQA